MDPHNKRKDLITINPCKKTVVVDCKTEREMIRRAQSSLKLDENWEKNEESEPVMTIEEMEGDMKTFGNV